MKMSVFHDVHYNKTFSQLAKESSFSFNLYRGRVNWKKLEELDVDRVVRDQDVELLHLHLNSITNCNLESEYDLKILDPNFIKLFRLAQLLIDFLLHCKKYLEHCIKVAHESLQTSNKEVEVLRKQLRARKTEVKQLKKKIKEVKQQLLLSPGSVGATFECSLCGKVFMSETFLQGHHSRRHQQLPHSLVLRPFTLAPASPHVKMVPPESEEKVKKVEEISSIKKKYQEEIEDLKKLFFAEIEKLKQKDVVQKPKVHIQTQYSKEEKQADGNESEKDTNNTEATKPIEISDEKRVSSHSEEFVHSQKHQEEDGKQYDKGKDAKANTEIDRQLGGEEEWTNKLEQREAVWRARLAALDLQHKKQVQQLQEKLNFTQLQGQEIKKDLENRLEEVLSKFEQNQKQSKINESDLHVEESNKKFLNDKNDDEAKPEDVEIPSEEITRRETPRLPPPIQKRRAFVSQKSKTIQDSFEIPEVAEAPENLVQVLNPEDDSDLENVSTLTQNSSKEKIRDAGAAGKNTDPVSQERVKSDDITGRSRMKESVIVKLLEEERLRSIADDKYREVTEEEDSTMSGSVTETERESESDGEGGERGRERREPQSYDDHMLKQESDLAQQSLQSMEALLAANPGILQQLRSDLEELVGRRLQGLGVDPTWRGLPPATYRDKMAALSHQRNITAKSHPIYFTLRDKLRGDAESAVALRSKAAPRSSPADSLLSRLRSKAAQVISAARFTRRLGSHKPADSSPKRVLPRSSVGKPLAASSPQLTPVPAETNIPSPNQGRKTTVVTKVQPADGESFSLSSSTEEEDDQEMRVSVTSKPSQNITGPTRFTLGKEDKDVMKPAVVTAPYKSEERVDDVATPSVISPRTQASYKSALRQSVSTSNLTKKKVLFVDQAFDDSKRSLSENTIAARENVSRPSGSESVASLVQEIQQQLSNRSAKPSLSVDLMKRPDSVVEASEIPLSEILPLTKSGRELLDSQSNSSPGVWSVKESTPVESRSPRSLEPLSQILQRVPTTKPVSSTSLGKKLELSEWSTKSHLQLPKLSPDPSISSIGSSLLDLSGSPRARQRPLRGTLEWDLQDLEDNLRD